MNEPADTNPVDPALAMIPFEAHRYEPFTSLDEFLNAIRRGGLGSGGALLRLHNSVASPEHHPRTWKWEATLRTMVRGDVPILSPKGGDL